MHAEIANEADVLRGAREDDLLVFEPGTVGWARAAEHFDAEDGVTLVRVTLFRGKHPTTTLQRGVAQGYEVLCRIGGGLFRIPKTGTPVMVGFPAAFATQPGAGVILCTTEREPDIQFSATRAKMDLGDDTDLVIKARSITLSDYDNRFLAIGPDGGIQVQDETGTGLIVKDGAVCIFAAKDGVMQSVLTLSADAIQALQMGGNALNIKGGNVTFLGSQLSLAFGSIGLGVMASPATPLHFGPAPMAGTPSTSIFGQA